MALFKGSEKISSQIGLTQYADVTELMKYMNTSIGDVGQVVFPLNESENKRRYLNGQIISQVQFPKFTEKLKNAVSLFPQISCTEEEWQTTALNDPDKQCGKFVIDDVTQTIRLPRIKYLVGNLNLYNISQGIPNRRLVKYKRPTDTDHYWYNLYSDGWLEQGNQRIAGSNEVRYTFPIPYNTEPQIVINRIRTTRHSVATNTDFHGMWNVTKDGFNSWGDWNGFLIGFVAYGYVDIPNDTIQYQNDGVCSNSQFEYPYYIQVAVGVEYDVDVTNEIAINSPYSYGMTTRSNIPLDNLSWLLSNDQFYSGEVYTGYYSWLLSKHNNGDPDIGVIVDNKSYSWVQETNTFYTTARNISIGMPVYGFKKGFVAGVIDEIISEDSFIFTSNVDNTRITVTFSEEITNMEESLVETDYNYIINTETQQFKLPLLVGDELVQSKKDFLDISSEHFLVASKGTIFYAPFNGYFYAHQRTTATSQYIGCYGDSLYNRLEDWNNVANSMVNLGPIFLKRGQALTDIRSNFVNATDKVVRFVKAESGYKYLYFYVGESMQNASLVDLGRLNEQIASIKRKVTEISGDSANGYVVYSDGWCEQWGYTNPTGSDVSMKVTLHKPMKDNRYQVFVNMQWTGDGTAAWQYINAHLLTTTNFEIVRPGSTPTNWKVTGYLY